MPRARGAAGGKHSTLPTAFARGKPRPAGKMFLGVAPNTGLKAAAAATWHIMNTQSRISNTASKRTPKRGVCPLLSHEHQSATHELVCVTESDLF